jgi:hypothetical protein
MPTNDDFMFHLIEGYRLSQERNIRLVEEFLGHIPDENEYLRRQGEKLLADIRIGLTKVPDQGAGEARVVRREDYTDEPEWHPGPLDTP